MSERIYIPPLPVNRARHDSDDGDNGYPEGATHPPSEPGRGPGAARAASGDGSYAANVTRERFYSDGTPLGADKGSIRRIIVNAIERKLSGRQ
jgi:hypothetical protein